MAVLGFLAEPAEAKKRKKQQPSSWGQIKNLLTCKQVEASRVHDPSKNVAGYSKLGSSCGSICSLKDVVHGSTRVVHRADNSPEGSALARKPVAAARSNAASSRTMQFRKLSGCYECHTIVDPGRYLAPRASLCACSHCGELFPKIESLELHQAVRHAVSELGPKDSGRNIVEIIFKSSWLKKHKPMCHIERILKVHNSHRTIQRFEDCRDAVKLRALAAGKRNPRCAADGNELLRFHCTTLGCALGARGFSALCPAVPACGVCTIIRHGFQGKAVRTMASSGRAHDLLTSADARRAMLVCRVIAGRVKRLADDAPPLDVAPPPSTASSYDSLAGTGIYSNLEELIVFNPRAILPCFVVVYKAVDV